MDSQGLIRPPNPQPIKSLTWRVGSYGYLEMWNISITLLSLAHTTQQGGWDNNKERGMLVCVCVWGGGWWQRAKVDGHREGTPLIKDERSQNSEWERKRESNVWKEKRIHDVTQSKTERDKHLFHVIGLSCFNPSSNSMYLNCYASKYVWFLSEALLYSLVTH